MQSKKYLKKQVNVNVRTSICFWVFRKLNAFGVFLSTWQQIKILIIQAFWAWLRTGTGTEELKDAAESGDQNCIWFNLRFSVLRSPHGSLEALWVWRSLWKSFKWFSPLATSSWSPLSESRILDAACRFISIKVKREMLEHVILQIFRRLLSSRMLGSMLFDSKTRNSTFFRTRLPKRSYAAQNFVSI